MAGAPAERAPGLSPEPAAQGTLASARLGCGRCREPSSSAKAPSQSQSHTCSCWWTRTGSRGGLGQAADHGHSLILPLRDPRGRFPDSAPGDVLPPLPGPREGTRWLQRPRTAADRGPRILTPQGRGADAQRCGAGRTRRSVWTGSEFGQWVRPSCAGDVEGPRSGRGQASEGPVTDWDASCSVSGSGGHSHGNGDARAAGWRRLCSDTG